MPPKNYLKVFAASLIAGLAAGNAIAEPLAFRSLDPPVGIGAREPTLFAGENGEVLLGWTEPHAEGFAVKLAVTEGAGWSAPRTVTVSDSLYVNWADFPSVVQLNGGAVAAHWLRESDDSGYAYDLNIAVSADEGQSWSAPVLPHDDRSTSQHGFASLLPLSDGSLMSVWLDGRAYDKPLIGSTTTDFPDAMQLRANLIGPDGQRGADMLVDAQTCSCCQTSAAALADGTVLVAYRDRTDAEIRDISVVRWDGDEWSDPVRVHDDGWEISGCPVNGPAIATDGQTAAVAWFTAANDVPAVKVAFSSDGGMSFADAVQVSLGNAAGRVDIQMLDGRTAFVTWVEWTGAGEVILACQVSPGEGCADLQLITRNTGTRSVNFPRMARTAEDVYLAWTQSAASGDPEPGSTVRVIFAPL